MNAAIITNREGWPGGGLSFDPLRRWRWWMSHLLTVGVILFLASSAKQAFFQSILHLILFLLLTKCYTLRRSRDYLQTQLLCFFILLAAAVMTVAFYFLFFFLAYLFLGTLGLILYSLSRREEGEAKRDAGSVVPRRLLRGTGFITGMIMVLIVFFFVFIPHLSIKRLDAPFSGREAPAEALTGFGEEVTFGEFKSLTPDGRVVMQVEPTGGGGEEIAHPETLYLRGMPLDHYDEVRWKRSPSHSNISEVDDVKIPTRIASAQRGRIVHLRFYQNPDITKRIFAPPLPQEVSFPTTHPRVRFDPETVSILISSFGHTSESAYTNPVVYDVTSNLIDEATPHLPNLIKALKTQKGGGEELDSRSAENSKGTGAGTAALVSQTQQELGGTPDLPWVLRGKPLTLSAAEQAINLQLPQKKTIEDIRRLARRIAPGPTPAEMALQAVTYLRKNFTYALEPETPPGMHPIEAFLFHTQKGHCEYFATSFVLMMRTRGVPARLVNGFYASEWNRLANVFVVKQSDAHTWAEIWLDGLGWLTVDPTPPSLAGRGAYGIGQPWFFEIIADYLRMQWQRYVIDYTTSKQVEIFRSLRSLPGLRAILGFSDSLRKNFQSRSHRRSNEKPDSTDDNVERTAWSKVVDGGVLLLVLFIGIKTAQGFKRRRLGARRSGIDYFDELADRLEKLGMKRLPQQTPAEFISGVEAAGLGGLGLDWLIGLYYRQRYAGQTANAEDRRRAQTIIRELRRRGKSTA
ncbi:DUF3488 domain-containing protein [Candidatus Sumerlaeota bacterium]|nr:DUF3488 domain-containing protein [Candidatus Sumerlaeota bacterium]